MSAFFQSKRVIQLSAWTFAVVLGVAAAGASAGKMDVKLSGDAEVPPVTRQPRRTSIRAQPARTGR
jgi:hypothetical protein